jgi:hypothetical protein
MIKILYKAKCDKCVTSGFQSNLQVQQKARSRLPKASIKERFKQSE